MEKKHAATKAWMVGPNMVRARVRPSGWKQGSKPKTLSSTKRKVRVALATGWFFLLDVMKV